MLVTILAEATKYVLIFCFIVVVLGFVFVIVRSLHYIIYYRKSNFRFKYVRSWLLLGAFIGAIGVLILKLPEGLTNAELTLDLLIYPLIGSFASVFLGFVSLGIEAIPYYQDRYTLRKKMKISPLLWHFYPIVGLISMVLFH